MFKDLNRNWLLPFLFIFFLALISRYFIIKHSPEFDKHTDLQLYINGGLLIVNHVNPYDFNDKKDVREKLRSNPALNESWLMKSEEKWNFYSSGNLPASILYYGAIEYFANGDAATYRLIFAVVDSILSGLIFLFIARFWIIDSQYLKFGLAVLLGALNPVLLYWGGLIPEDKGMQIALMIASLFFAKQNKLILSALFIGLAVSFKGLGIFILPLCLYYICQSPATIKQLWTPVNLQRVIKYGVFSFIAFGIFFIPFLPEVLGMMWTRLSSNLSGLPEHSSIWTIAFDWWPNQWSAVRNIFMVFFLSLVGYGILKKKFDFEIVSACILIFFVDISLNMGSLDRMNMGFLVAILILGASGLSKESLVLVGIYFVLGFAAFIVYSKHLYLPEQAEEFDAIFSLSLVMLFTGLLVHHLFNTSDLVNRSGLAAITVGVVLILWNARQTAVESVVRRILQDVGMGITTYSDVKLDSEQIRIARTLISANPNNYNDAQKAIAFGISESKLMIEIIIKVGLGKVNPDSIILSAAQRKIIDSIISQKPDDFNSAQKSLLIPRTSVFNPDKLLFNVGMGKVDPDSIFLTVSERKTIVSIISKKPEDYSALQKSLLVAKPKSYYLQKVLREVGMGRLQPDSVRLSASQRKMLDSIISCKPGDYNAVQKSLLVKRTSSFNPDKLLHNVGLGKVDPDSIFLTASQRKTIDSIISEKPKDYNVLQKSLLIVKPKSHYLQKILREVGMGRLQPESVRLSASQRKMLDSIISRKPGDYNAVQKSLLVKRTSSFNPDKLLLNVGLGKVDPDSIFLTASQRKTIDSIISKKPKDYNFLQKSLLIVKPKTYYLQKVLREVGMGRWQPESIRLSNSELKTLDSIISSKPGDYNSVQKSLLKKAIK